jgi:hypothetical protein
VNFYSDFHTLVGVKRLLFLGLVLLAGCSERIVIYHHFIKEEDMASSRMKTPDPTPAPPGERLVVYWLIPSSYGGAQKKQLELSVRYHSGELESELFDLEGRSGHQAWQVRGKRYEETGGIAAYRALLYADSQLIEEWRHLVWAEPIVPLDPLPQTQIASPSASKVHSKSS